MKTTDSINKNDFLWIFPLNVYAALLRSLPGQSPWLVYGELSSDDFDALQVSDASLAELAGWLVSAQQKRVDRVLSALDCDVGARVLEVGCGQGALVDLLSSRGFDVIGIDRHAAVLANATLAHASADQLVCCSFEQYRDDAGYDTLIFHNSARYCLPITLFRKALELLRPGGQLLICDEFVLCNNDSIDPQPLPLLDHVLALAKRMGFEVSDCEDLSADTNRFQQILVAVLERSQKALAGLTGESEADIQRLVTELQNETDASAHGARTHVLLSLHAPRSVPTLKNHTPGAPVLRNAADLTAESYRQVFEDSFSAPFDPALWSWKYDSGRGASVVAERGGQAVAHYGGAIRQIVYFSEHRKAVQICDVMVSPEERGFFSRNSLFFKTAASMLEQYAGYKADNLLGFGFPNLKAMHVAQRLGLYDKTDELMQIALAPQLPEASLPDEGWRVCIAEFDRTLRAHAEQLWLQMKAGFANAIIGVRDGDYLSYRFLQRPGLSYNCYTVMKGQVVKAVAFSREHGDRQLLMDIIAAPEHLEDALLSILRSAGQNRPYHFWLTAGQLARVTTQADHFHIAATGIQIPCNRWSPGPETQRLKGAWWLTAGDMDFL
ncbi:MAG: GNAT family N-acetyltransferase [Pseudohongiella sp.]|nr:GNAT family N-acetyltransferase [Pseudohongiella sp.]